jgi:hypothetical protein
VAEVAIVVAAAAAVAVVAAVAVAAAVLTGGELLQGRTAIHCLVGPSLMVDLRGGRTRCYPKDNTGVVIVSPTLML